MSMTQSPLPEALERLATLLGRFPSVGSRSAMHLAFHVLERPVIEAQQLAQALEQLHEQVGFCSLCGHLSDGELCEICVDPRRDERLLCVVEGIADVLAIEASGEFHGRYHVLGGVLSPLRGIGPSSLRLDELVERTRLEPIVEVIVATQISIEGEATASYIQRLLAANTEITVSRIASGVPQGSELEYLDGATLGRALRARQPL